MQNPFTTTFSKSPEYSYIATDRTTEILENFSYENPSESVYKITGVRGSGKTVILTKVEEELRSEENSKKGWIVIDVNPVRDMLSQIVTALVREGLGKNKAKSKSVSFTLEYGKWLRAGYPVYVVCTGLYENMLEVSNVKNLTFFRRATTIKTEPLNTVRMAETYRRLLKIDLDEAKRMALLAKGYAYAFQELEVLYFKKKSTEHFLI